LRTAVALHVVATRADAALVVPAGWIWGGLALAAAWAARRDLATSPLLVFAIALVVRALFVGTTPLLSDDVYRYVWEGAAVGGGYNPGTGAPAEIQGLDDGLRDRVNHNHIASIYPGGAMVWFWVVSKTGLGAVAAQLCAAVADAGTAAAITWWRRSLGAAIWPGLLYALHPLPVLESGHGAHVDVLAIAATTLAVTVFVARPWAAGVALGAGVGIKVFPAALLPALLRDSRWRTRALMAAGLGAVLLVPLLFADAPTTYARHWSFNGFAFPWAHAALGTLARPLLGLVGSIVVASTVLRRMTPDQTWLWVGAAFVFTTPTAHPWYLLWVLVPALLRGRWDWALGTVGYLGAYAVLATHAPDGSWTEEPWLWPLSWGPVVAALLAGWAHARRAPPADRPATGAPRSGSPLRTET
jgi:hypothetical protein